MDENKTPTDSVKASALRSKFDVEIGNRRGQQLELREKLIAVESEIRAFVEARDHLDKMTG